MEMRRESVCIYIYTHTQEVERSVRILWMNGIFISNKDTLEYEHVLFAKKLNGFCVFNFLWVYKLYG